MSSMLTVENSVNFEYRGWKQIKDNITRQYGLSILKNFIHLERLEIKTIKLWNDIIFLKRCKYMKIIPKGLRQTNNWPHIPQITSLFNTLESKILKRLLNHNFAELSFKKNQITQLHNSLQSIAPETYHDFTSYLQQTKLHFNLKYKTIHIKKFDNLSAEYLPHLTECSVSPATVQHKKSSVINLSTRILNEKELKLLELGLNYSLPKTNHNKLLIEAGINVECCLQDFNINEQVRDHIRAGISNILKSEINKPDHTIKTYSWITRDLKELKSDSSIVICPADKGNATVILNREDYNVKIMQLLEDPTYVQIEKDPTTKIEQEIKSFCLNQVKCKKLTKDIYNKLFMTSPSIPQFYGLPKIHKINIPLRPIVDFRYSLSYKLAFFLNKILKPIALEFPTTLKNSYQFSQDIQNLIIPEDYILISFDVKSLYTKVPIQDSLDYIVKRLTTSDEWKSSTNLNVLDIRKLIAFCFDCNFFIWNERIYKQNEGTPMGSPISPVVAELFMQSLETETILKSPSVFFYRRYVDDIFACIQKNSMENILSDLNNFHPSIQFTYELEENFSLPFLDVLISRDAFGHIHKKVYRKSTHTGRYLNFSSYHHHSHKISVVDALLYRAFIISDQESLNPEINHIRRTLMNNGYPRSFIERRIVRMRSKPKPIFKQASQQNEISSSPSPPRMILPFMGPITYRLTSYLRNQLGCDFGYIPGQKLSTILCSHKEKLLHEAVGVYKIPCSCSSYYIGETSRPLITRIKEHTRDMKNKNPKSAVAEHIIHNPQHQIIIDSASLIFKEPRYFHRKFMEGLFIRKSSNAVNKDTGMNINPIWSSMMLPILPTP